MNTGAPLAPSELVDIDWHAFLLHTNDYAEFCQRVAGRFIHHVPTDELERHAHEHDARATLARTTRAIEHTGLAIDHDLWALPGVKCTGCHNGCHDDPPPPPA